MGKNTKNDPKKFNFQYLRDKKKKCVLSPNDPSVQKGFYAKRCAL